MDLQYREVLATDPALPPEARAILSSGRMRIWTCFYESLQVGHCEGDTVTGEIISMSVLPAHRRRGIGTKLLTLVVDSLRAAGCSRIWLDAPSDPTLPAHGFYRALGWEPTGQGTGEPLYPGEILELPSKGSP
jgi:ribosomal protein S18 acetylase RimI-like enzyme